jgi:hypothetical protein
VGRRGGERDRFARLPVSVLESEAVRTLDHAAFKVLAVIASQYWGGNNGALALTPRYSERFGLNSKDTLYKSLRELVRRGLLIETRQGWRGVRNHFALYGLAWVDIHNREGQPLPTPEMCAGNLRKLYEWTESIPATGNEPVEIRTSHRGNSFPATGKETALSFPATGLQGPVSVPATGKTLRYLAGDTALAAARYGDALAIARATPTISIADLKARARCTEADAHRALQKLQAEAIA